MAVGEMCPVVYDPERPSRAVIGVMGESFDSRGALKEVGRLLALGLPVLALGVLLMALA
ncbi:hypothetical protein NX801_16395 [Streptomyces sp. LP05-1]|uniref:Uncharacterized protein n=1 Tax=Streptomyces pyxinae TaxID=2970734 RepID=A0ABT2CIH6_9ACTN|nr:DUF3592 domain-containing protein [Streptomyces sp. LP05-1]MCS0637213.1 hypothetical protein [Streptomyces sp. LP05-1]